MYLSKIKIAGFKSFVDPATIQLPSHLVAVVGPNGCGKSNIIDAVTWVMGESSPKYLRGEALTDVIFNGSSARKPVGQASVELIFDNSDGTIGGEYASYSELSVKRMINRDSESVYYLNGVRCRKRDAMDIFSGTGIGARSYSIIGQNMIARIVESKPEELSKYIKEAAKVSGIEDRQRETANRIAQTRENLTRAHDLQAELEKQLAHLKQQANVAQKYKTLKEEERLLRAQLLSLEWRQLDSLMVNHTLHIQREETALEAKHAESSRIERDMEQFREEQCVAQDAFQEIQRQYYAVGNEITRIEQDILHFQERRSQWENDLAQIETDWQRFNGEMNDAEDERVELARELEEMMPQQKAAETFLNQRQEEFSALEISLEDIQHRYEHFTEESARITQTAEVKKHQIENLETRIQSLLKRNAHLTEEKDRFNFTLLNQEIADVAIKADTIQEKIDILKEELLQVQESIQLHKITEQENFTKLNQVINELQRLHGQEASLQALQKTALGQKDQKTVAWLNKHGLQNNPRLAEHIKVNKGWELAVEKVLGFCLQAICVDDLKSIASHLNDFQSANICIYSSNNTKQEEKKSNNLLINQIKSNLPLKSLLSGIYIAENLEEALALCESLSAEESVITKDGIWLNRSWLKILREDNPAAGVFQREQELKNLHEKISDLESKEEEYKSAVALEKEELKTFEAKREQVQKLLLQEQTAQVEFTTQYKMKQQRLNELQSQYDRHLKEFAECREQLENSQNELIVTRQAWQEAMEKLEQEADERESIIFERNMLRQKHQQLREHLYQEQKALHQLEIKIETTKSEQHARSQLVIRLNAQLTALNDRKINLEKELTTLSNQDSLQKALSQTLDKHVTIESELNTARSGVESLAQEYRQLEDRRQLIERDVNKIRTSLEGYRLELQSWKVKSDTVNEQLHETQFELTEILKELSEEESDVEYRAKLEQVVSRINRLGPINLVAIDEYATCEERKQYLDQQVNDLESGLSTLEEAMAKIDKEMRTRFKDTFDQVNARFQELFPTIFGGGKAYLELVGDDLLEAGVTMMACPPGKRNSSIYLLSGGEKSLTALAFIFSIFYLNPAPFCLLDEVDAALDDANVIRFTRLVKMMSEKTQFIFISHNKISIEMAEHLIGVTMNEPGVSRLVSVDIEKAMTWAET